MKYLFSILTMVILFTACKKGSVLDNKSNNALNEQTVFSDSVNTISFLTRIYDDEGFAFFKTRWENGGTEQATDDSEFSLSNPARRPTIYYSSNYTADGVPGFAEVWSLPWTNIRSCNLLLTKLPTTPLAASTQKRVAAEARFLRAWYYYNLLINFGGVPIIKDQVFDINDFVNIPRNSFGDCVKYVSDELDAAATILPVSWSGNDYGRVTKGAALAVKAKLLLFAASPLFNGNSYPGLATDPTRTDAAGYATYSVSRWQAAADAAKAVMNTNTYALVTDNNTAPGYGFYNMFLQRINSEYIFYHNRFANKDFEIFYLPSTRNGSKYGTPTQTLVDAFPMANGKAITDPTSGYDENNPYVNRDPRFGYSIIYNGATYFNLATNSNTQVFTYVGAPTDGFVYNASTTGPTGYYSRKMCDATLAANSPGNTNRGWPLLRYADILLIYAEAINETGQTALAYPVLKQLRARAGIAPGTDGNYGINPNMDVVAMRAFVQNERHIELMYENTRWDDVRRWKIALTTQNGRNKLMQITKNANGTYSYKVVLSFYLHAFAERNYLLPIQTSEIRKAPAMVQNPGW
ncbi:RagB/SusD family nutrient uptake outer membrane protein [Pedobacter mendelii]|uniref:Membrane protein n=1 Tax=Pedobacter mendelii TaxID=1908240 RepID=A0ABQ2BDM5_9SPHI|nr:RagB/SusD family nutrient uptake outer membrane protein [Pedobacter mendelii]GGI23719.1 membrane protein [Pedobacter mendelii]